MLTEEQKKAYLEDGACCPYCDSSDREGGSIDVGFDVASQPIKCNNCGKQWDDIYTLTGIKEK